MQDDPGKTQISFNHSCIFNINMTQNGRAPSSQSQDGDHLFSVEPGPKSGDLLSKDL